MTTVIFFFSEPFLIVLYGQHKFLYERLVDFNLVPPPSPSGSLVVMKHCRRASPETLRSDLGGCVEWKSCVSSLYLHTKPHSAPFAPNSVIRNFAERAMHCCLSSSEEMFQQSLYPQECRHANSPRYWPNTKQTYAINLHHRLESPECRSDNLQNSIKLWHVPAFPSVHSIMAWLAIYSEVIIVKSLQLSNSVHHSETNWFSRFRSENKTRTIK